MAKIVICEGLAMKLIDEGVVKAIPPSSYLGGTVHLPTQLYHFARMCNSYHSSQRGMIVFEMGWRVEDSILALLVLE